MLLGLLAVNMHVFSHSAEATGLKVALPIGADTGIAVVDLEAVDAPTRLCLTPQVYSSLSQLVERTQSSVGRKMVNDQSQLFSGRPMW